VTILPLGGVTSISNAGPAGIPLKTFDERSLPDTRKSAVPLGVIDVTGKSTRKVFKATLLRFSRIGEPAPCGRIVRLGVALKDSFAVSVIRTDPSPTGE